MVAHPLRAGSRSYPVAPLLLALTLLLSTILVGAGAPRAHAADQGWYATVTTGPGGTAPATSVVYDDTHGGLTAVSGTPDLLSVTAERGTSRHQLIFQAPQGRSLRPGFYDQATDYPALAPRPGMEISGCDYSVPEGRFEIREFARQPNGVVDRLWLLYYEACPSGPRFGEIRIGLDNATARVEPSTTRWPLTYPGEVGLALPVRLWAGTSADTRVSGVSVTGLDESAFTVVDDPCTGATLPAETWDGSLHSCDVQVRFTPTRSGPHSARLRFATSQGMRYSALEGLSRPGQTEWTMTSDAERVGDGQTYRLTPRAVPEMGCSGGLRSVNCWAYDQPTGFGWYATFSPGTGEVLTPGSYRADNSGSYRPSMHVNNSRVTCRTYTGSFDVQEVAYSAKNPSEVRHFDVTFEQYCDGSPGALRGRIRYQASDDTEAPGRVSGLQATRSGGSATLTWTNPGDVDQAGTVVRYLPGRTAPPGPVTGVRAYSGTGTATTVSGLDPDGTYTFAVFTYDTSGNVSPARVVSLGSSPPPPDPARWYATVFFDVGTGVRAERATVFDGSNSTVSATADANRVDVNASGGVYGQQYTWSFAAPSGKSLRPGFYDQVTSFTSGDGSRPRASTSTTGSCLALLGHFEIRDIHRLADGSVDRLWLLYAVSCGNSGWTFGELRLGLPSDAVRVEAAAIRWPDGHGRVLGWVPVWVRAGTSDVTVTGVEVAGRHAQDFVVRLEDCTGRVIPAGERCLIILRAVPMEPGPRTARLTVSTSAGKRSVSLDAVGPLGRTDWVMSSEPGDYIGQGQQYDYSWDRNRFTVYGSRSQFHIEMQTTWDAEFRPAEGAVFSAGTTYENASGVRGINDGRPYLDVSGDGRACSSDRLTGWFRVDQARFTPEGHPDRFDVTFEQRCSATDPALRGRIRYRAEPDVTPPAPPKDVTVQRSGDTATLTWSNPTHADYAGTVVRYLPGTTAPPRPTTGIGAYSGTGTSTTVGGLDPDRYYTFAVFAYDRAGNVETPPPLPISTLLSIAVEPGTVTYGQSTVLSSMLTDEYGHALPGEQVRLESRPPGTTGWSLVTTLTTNSAGWVIHSYEPRANREVRFAFTGGSGLSPSTSGTFPVQVRPKVTARLGDTDVSKGTTVAVKGTVSPAHAGQAVRLQRYTSSGWTTMKTTKLSSTGTYRFSYTPTSAGEKLLRVLKPADADHATGWSPTRTLTVRR